ncbi:MAG: biotin-dependent carboxyltransferase family protein, partial [Clostridia bacterium]|nr:biotin-dependent carboxyltransferase family protein [Clostridia bacterium]
MSIRVIKAGALTTVQDRGRIGYQKSGIGTAGAMDPTALAMANRLVGNRAEAACLEMTMAGPVLEFDSFAICALTGADLQPHLGGAPVSNYQAFYVLPGQRLSFGTARSGCRGYLAVQGGIDVPLVMNSRSTDLKSHLGGVEGRALKDGDLLPIGKLIRRKDPSLKKHPEPVFASSVTVRVILGPQADYFSPAGIAAFFQNAFTVTAQSDRMGIRLSGTPVENNGTVDIVSDAITFGSIQIPPSGLPIILMADHQTTGGYAKLATVIHEDLSRLAQVRPGDTVRFVKADLDEVQHKPSFNQFWKGLFQR